MLTRTTTVLLLLLLVAAGCSRQYLLQDEQGNILGTPEKRYRVLSIFIDGLTPPEEDKEKEEKGSSGNPRFKKEPLKYREHGPYAAGLCGACHVQTGSNQLIMPVTELCQNCHVLNLNKKKVHGPVVAGGCKVCHDPHGSPYRFFLVSASKDFCFYCHSQKDVEKREVHKGTDVECTYCHNAHAADNEYLLKQTGYAQ